MKTLRDVLPIEATGAEFLDRPFIKYLDVEVFDECKGYWPGAHKNVHVWFKLINGYAVGWNENPGRGWSFPIHKMKPFIELKS